MNNSIQPIKLCIICQDEQNKAIGHSCSVCKKDAWMICNTCIQSIQNKPCPVCRTLCIHIPNNPTLQSTATQTRSIQSNIRNTRIHDHSKRLCYDISYCIFLLLRPVVMFMGLVYTGKLLYHLYCTGTCDLEKDNEEDCMCYIEATRDGYWKDFRYCILEAIGAILACGICYGGCCARN